MYPEPTDCTSLFATQSSGRSNNLDDLVTDFLVKELDVGELLGFANRIPKVDQLFSAAGESELTSVLRLLLRPIVIDTVDDKLIEDTKRLASRELFRALIIDVTFEDILS